MRFLGVLAVLSTVMNQVHSRKLLTEFQLPTAVADVVSYVSFASVSLLFSVAVGRGMFWALERWRWAVAMER